jgi:hypothetical protein
MKVPDKFLHIRNRSLDQCAAECSRNCSCIAYAYADMSGAGTMTDTRCLVWSGDLVDMKDNSGENLYLRLADANSLGMLTFLSKFCAALYVVQWPF